MMDGIVVGTLYMNDVLEHALKRLDDISNLLGRNVGQLDFQERAAHRKVKKIDDEGRHG
jgi:hypothetical protein